MKTIIKSMKTIINNRNRNIQGTKPSISIPTCNCCNKEACLLNWQCQIEEEVHEGTISSKQTNYKAKKVFWNWRRIFKRRLYNHKLSFRNEFCKNDVELSKEPWQIKMKNYTLEIIWRSIRKCLPYNYNNTIKCYLCLNKKLETVLYEGENLLNKKTELVSKCHH